MARLGLGRRWHCLMANDVCPKKAASYKRNFPPGDELVVGDVWDIQPAEIPAQADMAWASFPCQDLSIAGSGKGLLGERSGTFWGFWRVIRNLENAGKAPGIVVLENVCGALTSHQGKDFNAIAEALAGCGYLFGAVVIDAALFLPQSRPRLFIIAVKPQLSRIESFTQPGPSENWGAKALSRAFNNLPDKLRRNWVWWRLPLPPGRNNTLGNLIEDEPKGVCWDSPEKTQKLLNMMSRVNLAKVEQKRKESGAHVGTLYRRTRRDSQGRRVQRAEVRFDGLSGCLRTPQGGSSRQTLLFVQGDQTRSRLLSPREAARLMGAPDQYQLPEKYNEAYHLMGDGLAVPVVSWLEGCLLGPLCKTLKSSREAA